MIFRVSLLILLSFQLLNAQKKRVEVLPNPDVIYKLKGDIGFEDLNFGLRIYGVNEVSGIKSLDLIYYNNRIVLSQRKLNSEILSGYKKQSENDGILLHNFQEYLPISAKADLLKVQVVFQDGALKEKCIPLETYQQQNTYRLPVEGTWFVSSGHDFGVEHRRHLSRGHFAYDFVKVDSLGRQSCGDSLHANYSFGELIVAPAAGIVISASDSATDNPPGKVLSRKANFIEIDHGGGEVSRIVHLQQGSLLVNAGDSVAIGQPIARVGNSGYSETPHLHIGFQKNQLTSDGKTKSLPLPIEFSSYRVSWNQGQGQWVARGRPRRGQFVDSRAVNGR